VHLAALLEAGLLGVAEQDGRATVYLERRSDQLPVGGEWEAVIDQDWNAVWKAGFEPITVGDITVAAPWHPPGEQTPIRLVIEPAQAFGTGHHETTTACLAALQATELHGRSVFDVGTGTGVLALAAKALGAGRVLAVDVDPLAVEAATSNAAANGSQIEVRPGSADAAGGETFDVVVANIDTATLTALAADLVAAVGPNGRFIGSGISNERAGEAVAALRTAGLEQVTAVPGVEWSLLTAIGPPHARDPGP
jgi:ribosomal protein L11 methyltransferase